MDKNIPKEKKGFNKLPEDVQKKIDPKLAAEYRKGGPKSEKYIIEVRFFYFIKNILTCANLKYSF